MQSDKTIRFWDDYHDENDSQEWISTPGEELLAMIFDQLEIDATSNDDNSDGDGENDDISNSKNMQSSNSRNKVVSVLEIGCGTSTLVRDLKNHIEERDSRTTVVACGSDVSQVCIDTNRERDCPCADNDNTDDNVFSKNINISDIANKESSLSTPSSSQSPSLWYEVLNVLEGEPSRRDWDLILDKGCLDTFLFRSKQRGAQNKAYPESLRIILDKIHGWLATMTTTTGEGGGVCTSTRNSNTSRSSYYIFLSPRPKIKAVRDYAGFSSVSKYPLPGMYRSELEGKRCNDNSNNHNHTTNSDNEGDGGGGGKPTMEQEPTVAASPGYMFVCAKNDAYQPGTSKAFPCNNKRVAVVPTTDENSRCPRCPLTFRDFRRAEEMEFRGVTYWTRRWKAHCLHCKGENA